MRGSGRERGTYGTLRVTVKTARTSADLHKTVCRMFSRHRVVLKSIERCKWYLWIFPSVFPATALNRSGRISILSILRSGRYTTVPARTPAWARWLSLSLSLPHSVYLSRSLLHFTICLSLPSFLLASYMAGPHLRPNPSPVFVSYPHTHALSRLLGSTVRGTESVFSLSLASLAHSHSGKLRSVCLALLFSSAS